MQDILIQKIAESKNNCYIYSHKFILAYINFAEPVLQEINAIVAFEQLSTDEELGLLWSIYDNMGGMITPAATGAATLHFAQGLLDQVEQLPRQEQLGFMRDLVMRRDTALSLSYGVLTTNTKLAFWFQLAEMMRSGTVIPVPDTFSLSAAAAKVFGQVSALEFNQQITLLRNFKEYRR